MQRSAPKAASEKKVSLNGPHTLEPGGEKVAEARGPSAKPPAHSASQSTAPTSLFPSPSHRGERKELGGIAEQGTEFERARALAY